MFKKYMHVERFGTDEVQGIEFGEVYIFPKLDGTNGSLWIEDEILQSGSRNRQLDIHSDNAGFCNWAYDQKHLKEFFENHPTMRLYGEWLVPHSLKTYKEDAWKRFYVFDVENRAECDKILPYGEYKPMLDKFGIDYIPPICILRNATYDGLLKELDNNHFLIRDGQGVGEGIVLKNYQYQNKFGRTCWAKMITNSFKEKHVKEMGANYKDCKAMTEQQIVDTYVTSHLVDKTVSKIVNENQGWNARYIPQLLNTVFYDLVREDIWDAIKKMKMPTINFKTLNTLSIIKIKQLRPELF